MTMLLLSPFIIWLIGWIIGGSIFGFATNAIIRNKGYEENWFWWGFFFGIIAMLVSMSKPENVKPQRTQTDSWLRKDSKAENDKKDDVLTIPIKQYNHAPKLKPCSLTCSPRQGQYAFVIKLKCFREKEVTDVMMDIVLHTTFEETFTIKDIGFTNFEGTKYGRVSGMTEYPLPQAQFILIKQADIIIKKYVEGGKVIEISEEEMELKPYGEPLEEDEETNFDEDSAGQQKSSQQSRKKKLLIKRIDYNPDGSMDEWWEYSYDSQGIRIKYIRYDWSSLYGSSVVVEKEEYSYDSQGNRIQEVWFNQDGSVNRRIEHSYDSQGKRSKSITYFDESVSHWEEYSYDSQGNEVKRIFYWADGTIDFWEEYNYDDQGNMNKGIDYNEDGTMSGWYEASHDSYGHTIKSVRCDAAGAIFVNEYSNEYDSQGDIIKRTSYNEDGSMRGWEEYIYDAENSAQMQGEAPAAEAFAN